MARTSKPNETEDLQTGRSELSQDVLKIAIIRALESKPNLTTREKNLPDETIKILGIDVRRSNRIVLQRQIAQLVRKMVQRGVMRKYRAPNSTFHRIGLESDYEDYLKRLEIKKERDGRSKEVLHTTDWEDIPELPNLSDEVRSRTESSALANQQSSFVLDQDNDLDLLFDELEAVDSIGDNTNAKLEVVPQSIDRPVHSSISFLDQLRAELDSEPNILIERVLNSLRLNVLVDGCDHWVRLESIRAGSFLIFRSTFPCVESQLRRVLYESSQDSFESIIGLVSVPKGLELTIRRQISIDQLSLGEIKLRVLDFIGDTVAVSKALREL